MIPSILSLAALALCALPSITAAPFSHPPSGSWTDTNCPGKYDQCTADKLRVRKDFDTMPPAERKAYTDAVNCLMTKPSLLDQAQYPAAINRFFDYAVVHVNRTKVVHLDGYFLTWHRYFLWLYEEDLRNQCGYKGSFPYWNWPATADNLRGSAIFSGDEYSMSGDGLYNNTGPVVLAPNFSLPHGSGGGCVTTGPFANLTTTMANIPISVIIENQPLPDTAFDYQPNCLTRDLNTYVAQTYCNSTAVSVAVNQPDIASFSSLVNGVLGGSALGIHSGAHFTMGAPASSLFVSPQDPIWYPLHTMLDRVYTSWQLKNPSVANTVSDTMTAANTPPSDDVTVSSIEPDWGYFQTDQIQIGELVNTTAGPFCYTYDQMLS